MDLNKGSILLNWLRLITRLIRGARFDISKAYVGFGLIGRPYDENGAFRRGQTRAVCLGLRRAEIYSDCWLAVVLTANETVEAKESVM